MKAVRPGSPSVSRPVWYHSGSTGDSSLRVQKPQAEKSVSRKKEIRYESLSRDFRDLVWPRRGLLSLGLVLILVNRVAGLVLPGASKYLIDEVVQKKNLALLTPIAAAAGMAVVLQAVSSFALTQLLSKTAQRLIADLRVRVQRHIGRLPVRYYDENKTGALLSRIMTDVEGVRNLVGTGLVELLGGLLTAALAFALLLRINAPLTFGAVGFLGIFGALVMRAFRAIRPIFRERGAIQAEVSGRLSESLGGVRVVKGFHAEEREAETFASGAMRLFENVRRTLTAMSLMSMSGTLLMGVVSVTVMLVGGRLIVNGSMSLGDFVAFSLYLGLLIAPVFQVVNIGTQLTEALAGLDRMHEVLDEKPEHVDPQRTVTLDGIRGRIRFEDVFFEYAPGKPVLEGIDLEALPGTVTALVGPSGSGKSTIFGLVAAFAKPTRGRILVDDTDLSSVRLDSYRSNLGVVLQDTFLFDGTIRENILFGRPGAGQDQVAKAAAIARVDEFALAMEKGYDTVIGERGVKLSGGQRQRVAIARAILADPRILLLDEATSSLDTESEALIQEGLAALMAGRTTFVIAHRLSTIRSADQILVLESGRIAERGTHAALLARRGTYYGLYTRQAGVQENIFVNPGETQAEPEPETRPRESQEPNPLDLLRGKQA
jgi:ABC-type multidrug transport system fused ATPase/permease subunit